VTTNFFIGLTVSALFILQPDALVSLFLSEGESGTEAIALSFIAVFWPAFLFNGVNITLASYLTALHKPLQSAAIAISRSLVLPALGLLLLPRWLGDTGIFIAVPVAELLTLALGLILVAMNRPSAIVAALGPGQKSPLN
jgi:Na+-driven multidrug efflux pump